MQEEEAPKEESTKQTEQKLKNKDLKPPKCLPKVLR